MSLRGLYAKYVFAVSDGQASSPQPWAFLSGHQKEHEKETLGEGRLEKAQCLPLLGLPILQEVGMIVETHNNTVRWSI